VGGVGVGVECRTVGYAVGRWDTTTKQPIKLYAKTFTETKIDIGTKSITVSACPNPNPPNGRTSLTSSTSYTGCTSQNFASTEPGAALCLRKANTD
jgi:hypothetical protein